MAGGTARTDAARVAESDLSAPQRRVLDAIVRLHREKGYAPTVREIGDACGLASTSTVHAHLMNLEDAGWLRSDPTKPRTLEVLLPTPEHLVPVMTADLTSMPKVRAWQGTITVTRVGDGSDVHLGVETRSGRTIVLSLLPSEALKLADQLRWLVENVPGNG